MERPTTPRSKALVIYDDEESGNIWGYSLKQIGIDVMLISASEDVLKAWSDELPDLIVIEDFNPECDELEICRDLRRESPVPILLLTYKTDEAFQVEAYRAGVDECIVQPISPRLFLFKVRAWMGRMQSLPISALEAVQIDGFRLDAGRRRLSFPDGRSLKLTNLEARLLYILMSQPGKVFDSGILVERVWGCYSGGDNVLLKNIVYRLRRKIEPDPTQPSHLLTEGSQGYLFRRPEETRPAD
jgi:DNA-binding response OmpR family regulator